MKENVLIKIENYTYLKCDNCSTLTCDPLPPSNVIVYGSDDDFQWRHYVDIGAGIDFMCGVLPTNSVKYDLVDIGFGFGFTLDYWNFIQNRNASIGFDESFMSVKGKEFLNVDLELPTSNLSEFLKNRSSDLVIASEVIEHVISPNNFLQDLLTLIKQNNCKLIILTTPSSEFLLEDIENVTPTKIASLSPGFHTCILSIKALELILKNLGIDKNFYKIERRNERLIIKI